MQSGEARVGAGCFQPNHPLLTAGAPACLPRPAVPDTTSLPPALTCPASRLATPQLSGRKALVNVPIAQRNSFAISI